MIKIGIELNNVVRNINYQVMKYYKKDINPSFDETRISSNKTSIIEDIPFESNDARNNFVFIDYPYELFGCARVTERNLSVTINDWLIDLADNEKEEYDVSFFSLRENDLSIPSSYYFLSKIATRVRTTHFPTTDENIWDLYDIIITTNVDLVKNKPEGKVVVLIEKEDNIDVKENADYSYASLSKAINDNSFINHEITYSVVKPIYGTVMGVPTTPSKIEEMTEDNEKIETKSVSFFERIRKWFE